MESLKPVPKFTLHSPQLKESSVEVPEPSINIIWNTENNRNQPEFLLKLMLKLLVSLLPLTMDQIQKDTEVKWLFSTSIALIISIQELLFTLTMEKTPPHHTLDTNQEQLLQISSYLQLTTLDQEKSSLISNVVSPQTEEDNTEWILQTDQL